MSLRKQQRQRGDKKSAKSENWCDEMLFKPFKKKNLKFELITWEHIDVSFAPLLLLNRTEELSDETPNFRKQQYAWNGDRQRMILDAEQLCSLIRVLLCPNFTSVISFANSPHELDPVLAQLSWRQCVDLHVFYYIWFHFFLACEIQLNPHFMVWTK